MTTPFQLHPPAFTPLPLGTIRPTGWLKRQLEIQRDGISGHLHECWPDVRDSAWFGGDAEGWERVPYWLDGAIPLAWLLNDEPLKQYITDRMDYVLSHENEHGWIGPGGNYVGYDLWGFILLFKPLIQFYEVTQDPRVPNVIEKSLRNLERHIRRETLHKWAQTRWFEALIAIFWLYERSPAQWLTDLAVTLRAQGFDWPAYFERWPWTMPTPRDGWNQGSHVVNNAMMVKSPALWWRVSGDPKAFDVLRDMLKKLDQYHGAVWGGFNGDECLVGPNPKQGAELCAVVELMYALEESIAVTGDPALADRLEKVAFNALPATFSPDMRAHQYHQQVNQVQCSVEQDFVWHNSGPDANIFGFEPLFGCCTANLSQGWPKLASHLWMRAQDGGLASIVYAPCNFTVEVNGNPITVTTSTNYPFRETIQIVLESEQPTEFPLHLRIPTWAQGAMVMVNGRAVDDAAPGTFCRLSQTWHGTHVIDLHFPMTASASRRFNNALSIERGPLVYALKIEEAWHRLAESAQPQFPDYEVFAQSPWNYALEMDEATVETLRFEEHRVGSMPFSPEGAPVSTEVNARRVAGWDLERGCAADTPVSPVTAETPLETVTLIPYGCTNLRVAEFPTLKT